MAVDPNSVIEILRKSLLLVGAISQGEQPDDAQAQDALNILKNMLDSWSTDQVDIYTVQPSVFVLGTKQIYTAGPGGDFNMVTPPLKIEAAALRVTTTTPNTDLPLKIYTPQEWSDITIKTVTSPIPQAIWPDYQWPLCNISVYPVPTGANSLVLYMWQLLTNISLLTDTVSFPPGYTLAIIYNLATTLSPFYGAVLSDDIKMNASLSKNKIERRNLPTYYLKCDDAVAPRARTFNWLTGDAY